MPLSKQILDKTYTKKPHKIRIPYVGVRDAHGHRPRVHRRGMGDEWVRMGLSVCERMHEKNWMRKIDRIMRCWIQNETGRKKMKPRMPNQE